MGVRKKVGDKKLTDADYISMRKDILKTKRRLRIAAAKLAAEWLVGEKERIKERLMLEWKEKQAKKEQS